MHVDIINLACREQTYDTILWHNQYTFKCRRSTGSGIASINDLCRSRTMYLIWKVDGIKSLLSLYSVFWFALQCLIMYFSLNIPRMLSYYSLVITPFPLWKNCLSGSYIAFECSVCFYFCTCICLFNFQNIRRFVYIEHM